VNLIWAFLSLVSAVLVATLGELVSDEIRARMDRVPFAVLAAAARRLPADQQADLHKQAWLPELHHILRGDQAKPITRLIHGTRYAVGLWLAAPAIGRELERIPQQQETSITATVSTRPNLLEFGPVEFEHLIRQLFEAIGFRNWITQASPDGGVDGVVYNDRPVAGGLYVIQAKRYRHAIGLNAVRALAGDVAARHAAKGILVTTSPISAAARNFAARHGRIEVIDGCSLTSMLAEYLALDTVIPPPNLPPN
jgi:hypothetical protein